MIYLNGKLISSTDSQALMVALYGNRINGIYLPCVINNTLVYPIQYIRLNNMEDKIIDKNMEEYEYIYVDFEKTPYQLSQKQMINVLVIKLYLSDSLKYDSLNECIFVGPDDEIQVIRPYPKNKPVKGGIFGILIDFIEFDGQNNLVNDTEMTLYQQNVYNNIINKLKEYKLYNQDKGIIVDSDSILRMNNIVKFIHL